MEKRLFVKMQVLTVRNVRFLRFACIFRKNMFTLFWIQLNLILTKHEKTFIFVIRGNGSCACIGAEE